MKIVGLVFSELAPFWHHIRFLIDVILSWKMLDLLIPLYSFCQFVTLQNVTGASRLQLAIVISNLCLQPATGNMQLATCILQHATCTSHPSISNYTLQPVTCNFNLKHKVCSPRLQMCKLKQHWGLHHHFWCMISHHHHHHQVEHARFTLNLTSLEELP